MNNFKKIILTTFVSVSLAGFGCYEMNAMSTSDCKKEIEKFKEWQKNNPCSGISGCKGDCIQNYSQFNYAELKSLNTKFNNIVNYLQTYNKVNPTSEAAQKIATLSITPLAHISSYDYKDKIKALIDYLKSENIITDEEYNKFKILIG
jgi:hypothetical protein